MIRLAILLLSRRWGIMVIGAILVISGLIWGLESQQVTYQSYQQGSNYEIGAGTQSGNVYINAKGSSDYFAAFNGDFTPPIAQSNLDNWVAISFVARTDYSGLNTSLNTGSTKVTEAHKIEKLVFYDQNGNIAASYTTTEYNANPNGFTQNNWLYSIWLILAGVVVFGLAFVLGKKPQTNASFSIGANGTQAYQQPYAQPNPYGQPYPQSDPYGQAYQSPQQYPQGVPYPPQQPVYGQPVSNPYQQPQE